MPHTTFEESKSGLNAGSPDQRKLPPDPEGLNDVRSETGRKALYAFCKATSTDIEDAVADLIANIMHACDRHSELGDFVTCFARSERQYLEEIGAVGMYADRIEERPR